MGSVIGYTVDRFLIRYTTLEGSCIRPKNLTSLASRYKVTGIPDAPGAGADLALQREVKPHFIFNVFYILVVLCLKGSLRPSAFAHLMNRDRISDPADPAIPVSTLGTRVPLAILNKLCSHFPVTLRIR